MVDTSQAERVHSSDTMDHAVRAGLVAYGVVHIVVAALGVNLALQGDEGGAASQQGAFAQIGQSSFGTVLLLLIAAGFAALVVWQVLDAAVGHRDSDGAKRVFKRVTSAGRTLLYAALGFSAARTALGSGSSKGSGSDGLTARLMSAPGGTWLVGLVGAAVIAVGLVLVHRGWTEKFTKRLDGKATSGDRRGPIVLLGKVGYIAKGVALAAVGGLFVTAAVRHQPKKSGGLDVALHEMLRQPFGVALATGVALGLGCFGVFCLAWARHLRR